MSWSGEIVRKQHRHGKIRGPAEEIASRYVIENMLLLDVVDDTRTPGQLIMVRNSSRHRTAQMTSDDGKRERHA
jgi:hypothetical protein